MHCWKASLHIPENGGETILVPCARTGVTFTPDGVTIVGVTTLIPAGVVAVVVVDATVPAVVLIFWVAAAAAASAAIPLI